MNDALKELITDFTQGGLSRRQLATGLSAATAVWATSSGVAAAQAPSRSSPASQATFVPGATGGGADDSQPIQDAINAAAAAGGGKVVINQPLLTGSTLTMKTGVELAGEGRLVSSIGPHATFSAAFLITTEPDAHHVTFRELSVNTGGLVWGALIEAGAGSHHILVSGVRLSGWNPASPGVSGVRCESEPDPGGSNTRIRHVSIEGCEFDGLGNGIKISAGAEHVSVTRCGFSDIRRRCFWILGLPGLNSSYLQLVGNTMVDFPMDPELRNPLHLGNLGTVPVRHLQVIGNTVIGNGSYHGAGGFGTPDHYTMKCVQMAQVIGNVSVDAGESGFTMRDSSDVIMMGNASVRSDTSGYAVVNKEAASWGLQFISNLAWNNGQNRGGETFSDVVQSGFLIRNPGLGIRDTHFLSNRAWDDQPQKTQNYGLAIESSGVRKTRLTANLWRDAQHVIAARLNRGLGTREAHYDILQADP